MMVVNCWHRLRFIVCFSRRIRYFIGNFIIRLCCAVYTRHSKGRTSTWQTDRRKQTHYTVAPASDNFNKCWNQQVALAERTVHHFFAILCIGYWEYLHQNNYLQYAFCSSVHLSSTCSVQIKFLNIISEGTLMRPASSMPRWRLKATKPRPEIM